jgi:hypothetical protein
MGKLWLMLSRGCPKLGAREYHEKGLTLAGYSLRLAVGFVDEHGQANRAAQGSGNHLRSCPERLGCQTVWDLNSTIHFLQK